MSDKTPWKHLILGNITGLKGVVKIEIVKKYV